MKFIKLLLCFFVSIPCVSITANSTKLIKAISQIESISQKKISIYYKNNTLFVKGLSGNGNLKIYSIIGNIISDIDIQDLTELSLPLELIRQNMYIIRIETFENKIFTNKIIAR